MNKLEILEKAKSNILKSEKVFIADWEDYVVVRQLSGKQYIDVSNDCLVGNSVDRKKFLNYAIISSVYDDNGEQVFSNDDLETLLGLSADAYSSLVMAITRLNNLDGETKHSKNLKKVN